jgi:hypothetical protein
MEFPRERGQPLAARRLRGRRAGPALATGGGSRVVGLRHHGRRLLRHRCRDRHARRALSRRLLARVRGGRRPGVRTSGLGVAMGERSSSGVRRRVPFGNVHRRGGRGVRVPAALPSRRRALPADRRRPALPADQTRPVDRVYGLDGDLRGSGRDRVRTAARNGRRHVLGRHQLRPVTARAYGSSSRTAITPARISPPPTNWVAVGVWCSRIQANSTANPISAIATNDPNFGPSRRAAPMPVT